MALSFAVLAYFYPPVILVKSIRLPLPNLVRTLIMKTQYLHSISTLSVVRLINKPLILQPFGGTMISYKGVKCHALFNWFVCQFY